MAIRAAMAARFAGRPLQEKNKQERKASEVAPSRWWPGVPARRGRSGSPFARLHCGGWPLLSVSLLLIFFFGFLYLFHLTVFQNYKLSGVDLCYPAENNDKETTKGSTITRTQARTRAHARTHKRSRAREIRISLKTKQKKVITKTGKEDNS